MSEVEMDLTDEQVGLFELRGFLSIPGITSTDEIEALRTLYDEVFEREMGCSLVEMGSMLRLSGRPLLVIYPPRDAIVALQETTLYRRSLKMAARLMGVEEGRVIGGLRMFSKPARYGPTDWHQDAAYRPPPHETMSFWVPLDPVTPDDSCLWYIPGSHVGRVVRPHREEGDHLVTGDVDRALAVECPVPVTGAVAHHSCVLHRAGPNATDRPRRALGIVCIAPEPAARAPR